MASPPTSPSRLSQRRNAVPLLLSAFPVPPSHIPQSPLALTPNSANPATPNSASPAPSNPQNPPPSLPPASPLPPLPGPSPISEHDTLRFITAARSRRASKLSLASSSSHSIRDSTASSVFSLSNYHSRPSSPPESSSRSIRSLSSNGSLSYSHRHAVDKLSLTEPRICEEDPADLTRMSLDEITPAAASDAEAEVEDLLEFGLRPSLSKKSTSSRHRGHGLNDSISSIDMRDLPALQEDELESMVPPPPPPPPTRVRQLQSSASTSLSRQISRSKLNKELPPLPGPSQEAGSRRADSPDIGAILASTPKPRRKSSPSLASTSRSVSRTRSSRSGPKRRVSAPLTANGSSISISVESFDGLVASQSELPYIRQPAEDIPDDASFVSDYGVCVDKTGTAIEIFDKETEDRLERELEGAGSDSDSSIDLHTPLPNLMLREGMLSPNSKLLSQRSGAPSPVSGRPGSMFSVASSMMTKSGIYKDERDTVHRRTRHRDGRLLRGGIGLTTGLGWSDSEDEDAPSALTRRVSSLVLSRKASSSSLQSPLPLSRSVSDTLASASSALARERTTGRSSLPPTSWHRTTRTSTGSSVSGDSLGGPYSARTSAASGFSSAPPSRRTSESTALSGLVTRDEQSQDTSSTASTSSLVTPVTAEDPQLSTARPAIKSKSSLSSLRAPRRIPSGLPSRAAAVAHEDLAMRKRTVSGSSASSIAASVGSHRPVPPRPLRLPQSSAVHSDPARSDPPRPVSKLQTPRARTVSATSKLARPSQTVPLADERPKPRTGTGMAYRTSSRSAVRPPASSLLRPSHSTSSDRKLGIVV